MKKKISVVVILVTITGLFGWTLYRNHQHRIVVLFPDGSVVPYPTMKLDYDPISYEYHPVVIQGDDRGVVHIPMDRAYGRGWEWMYLTATRDNKKFLAKRIPEECSYPMVVSVEELPPVPPAPKHQSNQLDEMSKDWNEIRQVVESLIKKFK